MLACNTLRIDPGDGSPATEYRVEDDHVECRQRPADASGAAKKPWQPLTSEQISSHIMSDTVVAYWLRRRMGFRRLLRACNPESSFVNNEIPDRSNRRAA